MQSVTGCCHDLSMFPALAFPPKCTSLNVTIIVLLTILLIGNIMVIEDQSTFGREEEIEEKKEWTLM